MLHRILALRCCAAEAEGAPADDVLGKRNREEGELNGHGNGTENEDSELDVLAMELEIEMSQVSLVNLACLVHLSLFVSPERLWIEC